MEKSILGEFVNILIFFLQFCNYSASPLPISVLLNYLMLIFRDCCESTFLSYQNNFSWQLIIFYPCKAFYQTHIIEQLKAGKIINTDVFGSTGSFGDSHFVPYSRKSVTLNF